ncbi:hypothetical protein, partial [Acinetobacter pittii]|uniref:hypothetical protein n=1 Tax=Acinetobacter pittii TaxID=48296 RepID=UPI0013D660AA
FVSLHNDPYIEIDLRGVWGQLGEADGASSVILGLAYEQVLAAPVLQALASGAAYAVEQAKDSIRRERANSVV